MEKKESETNLSILLTNLVDYVREDNGPLIFAVMQDILDKYYQELDKAREEGFDSGVEKTVNIIQEGLDELLLEKDGEKYWVGDILRDCGSSVEKILPQNMKHYLLSKLKTKE